MPRNQTKPNPWYAIIVRKGPWGTTYRVSFKRRSKPVTKSFRAVDYGSARAALKAARAWRDKQMQTPQGLKPFRSRSFSVARYGYDGAYELAVQARDELVAEVDGYIGVSRVSKKFRSSQWGRALRRAHDERAVRPSAVPPKGAHLGVIVTAGGSAKVKTDPTVCSQCDAASVRRRFPRE
jgi:hypothetical protein